MPTTVITLKIATVEDALREPAEFEVSHSILGWTLSYAGEGCATCVSTKDALRIVRAQKAWVNRG